MANNTLNTRIVLCSKTASEWANDTTVVLGGELCIESDTRKIKIGVGTLPYKDLPYATMNPEEVQQLINQVVEQTGHIHTNKTVLDATTASFTTELLAKLNGIEAQANKTIVDSALDSTSANPVENKAVKAALDEKVNKSTTINGKDLSGNITLSADDVGADASGAANTALANAKTYADTQLNAAKSYADTKVANLVGAAPEILDTFEEVAEAIQNNETVVDALNDAIGNKVDKVAGKGLSTNDLTNALKENYDAAYAHSQSAHAPANAEKNVIVGVQKNGVDLTVDANRKVNVTVPTKVSDLTNDLKYLVKTDTIDKATQLANTKTIDGVAFNGTENITHYGTCSTEAATAAKTVNITGFSLATGARAMVKFTTTNTATNPTLNVNNTGAAKIYYRGAAIAAGTLAANRVYEFVYDGTNFEFVGDVNSNTTYTAGSGLSLSGTTFNHSNSITPGTAQGDDSKNLAFGDSFTIPTVTYDAQGHIIEKGTTTITMPAAPTTISGNAATATKLKNARNFSISGGATAAAVSFDGSGDVSLNVTKVNANVLYQNSGDVLVLDGSF